MIFGRAKDGKEFSAESAEVIAYRETYPDTSLEVAIGSVIMDYERSLEPVASEGTPVQGDTNEAASADDIANGDAADSTQPEPEAQPEGTTPEGEAQPEAV